jgi:1,2-diacylglycerol 3-beta-glucosyltransferase
MITVILFAILFFYLLVHAALFTGIIKNSKKPSKRSDILPSVSIIVAARNEESCIGKCIESLLMLDYPPDKLEIIMIRQRK